LVGFRTKSFSPLFPERNNPISALRMTVSIVYQAWRPQKLRVLDKDLPADHASAPADHASAPADHASAPADHAAAPELIRRTQDPLRNLHVEPGLASELTRRARDQDPKMTPFLTPKGGLKKNPF
jgi:hypothetical protein